MEKKNCPYCGEEILAEATKCKHCKEWFDNSTLKQSTIAPKYNIEPTPIPQRDSRISLMCWIAIFLQIILFFKTLEEYVNLNNVTEFTRLGGWLYLSSLIPDWLVLFLGVIEVGLFIWILLIMRTHFIAKKTIFTQYIILLLLSTGGLVISSILENEFNIASLMAIVAIYEIIIGIKLLRNFLNTVTLGIMMIINAVVGFFTLTLPDMVELSNGEEVIVLVINLIVCMIWIYTIKYYFQSAPKVAIASNLETSLQSQKEALNPMKNTLRDWTIMLMMVVIGLVCVFVFKSSHNLYLIDDMQMSIDKSYSIGIASDDEIDTQDLGKGWCGDLQIVVNDTNSKSSKLTSILKSSEINAQIISIFPSSISPYLVYFNTVNDDLTTLCGKVHIPTKKYTLFEGDIIGIITKGRFEDCYLVQRGENLCIFKQSPIGESSSPVCTFNKQEYLGDAQLYDPDIADSVIKWLEKE